MNDLRKHLSNVLGWRTKRKIVVIESDDWGSVRTRSSDDYRFMLQQGLEIDRSNFTKFDALESNTDLENLFELLSKHTDSTGRNPVITPMCVVANPDFKRLKLQILLNIIMKYSWKLVKDTLSMTLFGKSGNEELEKGCLCHSCMGGNTLMLRGGWRL